MKRLENATKSHTGVELGETLADLLDLSSTELASLPGIGLSYINTFEELKLLSKIDRVKGKEHIENIEVEFTSIDTSNMRISLAGVDNRFAKPLKKYAKYINIDDINDHVDVILNFDSYVLIKKPSFGKTIVDRLVEFQKLIKNEINLISSGDINYENFESAFIVPKRPNKLTFTEIEEILLEDIDNYFDKLSADDVDIIQKRWGFVDSKRTLEDIAESFNLTRERIRQKEAKINIDFIQHLRLNQSILWEFIEPELCPNIINKLKDIFSCFSSEKDFYDFLDLICGQEKLIEYVYPKLEKTILNTYFVENGAPVLIDDIKEYLTDLNLKEVMNIDNAISVLNDQNAITIEAQYVWPRYLSKAEATACVLVKHKKGLPWLDIAKIVNYNSYSRTLIQEDRLENAAFELPDYIFLGGKGVYKHTKFIDMDEILVDDIFIELMEYVEEFSRNVFHLNECYQASSILQRYDYYDVRYFVKNFGEDYGFYFDGRSQADSVGLKRNFQSITQKDVIIESMKRHEKPLTKPEVANLLKSKSLNHAAFYLDEMISSGQVVQVDRMLYTIPDLAYRDIDIEEYIKEIGKLLRKYDKPVEPSILRNELNTLFSSSYSKYFYASIARLYTEEEGWFRKYNLYSINEIPFQSLNAVLNEVCDLEFTIDENINLLQKYIAIDHKSADRAIRNWQHYSS